MGPGIEWQPAKLKSAGKGSNSNVTLGRINRAGNRWMECKKITDFFALLLKTILNASTAVVWGTDC